jgi:Spy/CpxP family protein refolding chaperone
MMQQRPGNGPGNFRGGGMPNRGNMRGGFHGGREQGGFHIGPEGMWWRNPMVVQRLTLTPDQVKHMDGIFQESRLQLIDLRANVEKQEVMLEPLLSANPLDTAKAQLQIDKVADARADLEKANAKMLLGIRGVLTPDQWTKLSTHGRDAAGQPSGPGQPAGPTGGQGRTRGMRPAGPANSSAPAPPQ